MSNFGDRGKAWISLTGKSFVEPHACHVGSRGKLRHVPGSRHITERRKEKGGVIFFSASRHIRRNVCFRWSENTNSPHPQPLSQKSVGEGSKTQLSTGVGRGSLNAGAFSAWAAADLVSKAETRASALWATSNTR